MDHLYFLNSLKSFIFISAILCDTHMATKLHIEQVK